MHKKSQPLQRHFDENAGAPAPSVQHDPAEWIARHGEILRRYALARVSNPFIAEELVQDTFAAALQNLDRFMGRSAEQTWLVGILRHKILDHYRRNTRENRAFDRSVDLGEMELPQTGVVDARESLIREEGRSAFWKALENGLQALPQRTAQAYRMVEIEALDTDTVCARLGVTKSNLWVMLHRARKQLRDYLRDELKLNGTKITPQALCQVA